MYIYMIATVYEIEGEPFVFFSFLVHDIYILGDLSHLASVLYISTFFIVQSYGYKCGGIWLSAVRCVYMGLCVSLS